ncbi:MAG: hypothetical protein MN733_01790, partial [Nitrososphaera sp.]|nr:hypothetical protein [Nitrososphaera sp.]
SMVFAFRFLGYFGSDQVDARGFYLASATAFACPVFWRWTVVGRRKDFYDLLCFVAIFIALLSAWYNRHEETRIAILWILLVIYVLDLVTSRGLLSYRRTGDLCLLPGTYRASKDLEIKTDDVKFRGLFGPHPDTKSPCSWELLEASSTFAPMTLLALAAWLRGQKDKSSPLEDALEQKRLPMSETSKNISAVDVAAADAENDQMRDR